MEEQEANGDTANEPGRLSQSLMHVYSCYKSTK